MSHGLSGRVFDLAAHPSGSVAPLGRRLID